MTEIENGGSLRPTDPDKGKKKWRREDAEWRNIARLSGALESRVSFTEKQASPFLSFFPPSFLEKKRGGRSLRPIVSRPEEGSPHDGGSSSSQLRTTAMAVAPTSSFTRIKSRPTAASCPSLWPSAAAAATAAPAAEAILGASLLASAAKPSSPKQASLLMHC